MLLETLTTYYRRFIHRYASIAAPLTDLTKTFAPANVSWTEECDRAFKESSKVSSLQLSHIVQPRAGEGVCAADRCV